jgi:hypothetical protein
VEVHPRYIYIHTYIHIYISTPVSQRWAHPPAARPPERFASWRPRAGGYIGPRYRQRRPGVPSTGHRRGGPGGGSPVGGRKN